MERKQRDDARYSQECIVDAFIYLLGEKSLQDITVTEICKKAGVARITFYKYYKTISDVLKAAVDFKFAEFKEELTHAKLGNDIRRGLEISITAICALRKPLKSIAKSKLSGILLQYFTESLITLMPTIVIKDEYEKSRYLFLSGGIFNILSNWVATDMAATPKQLADQIYVVAEGFWQ